MIETYSQNLKEAGLKITPQRIAVLEAVHQLTDHPTADRVIDYIRKRHPGIASGTVYKVLSILVDKKLIRKVKTDRDVMHYDGILEPHHHLYCVQSDRITDFMDPDLDIILQNYFQKNGIQGFKIDEIRLQINGEFVPRQKMVK